jgi:hypothetical protein
MPTFFSAATKWLTPAVTDAVKAAQDSPSLVQNLAAISPVLAQQITGKPLAASKSPIGTVLVAAAAWASAKYGFGWDASTDTLVGGIGALIGGYLMRSITSAPITGLFSTPAELQSAPPVVPPASPS